MAAWSTMASTRATAPSPCTMLAVRPLAGRLLCVSRPNIQCRRQRRDRRGFGHDGIAQRPGRGDLPGEADTAVRSRLAGCGPPLPSGGRSSAVQRRSPLCARMPQAVTCRGEAGAGLPPRARDVHAPRLWSRACCCRVPLRDEGVHCASGRDRARRCGSAFRRGCGCPGGSRRRRRAYGVGQPSSASEAGQRVHAAGRRFGDVDRRCARGATARPPDQVGSAAEARSCAQASRSAVAASG